MGYYINPPDRTKEEWLADKALKWKDFQDAEQNRNLEERVICLVSNGAFTAAFVIVTKSDVAEVLSEIDPRPKSFFTALLDDLISVTQPDLSTAVFEI